ncbi:hypothetical protein PCE1_003789 [Barthelona sp. PCE]
MHLNLDSLIERLISVRNRSNRQSIVPISESEILSLIKKATEVLKEQPVCLELRPPLKICGDIHGQFLDLLRLFQHGGFPPDANYLFLGDYVDRGPQSVETLCLLLAYKVLYKSNFFLLRGNHESRSISRVYGFYDELKRRFVNGHKLWEEFCSLFEWLPISAIVADRILCIHGGISPHLHTLDDLRAIRRPTELPEEGLLCDLLWSDPDSIVSGYGPNDRGVSVTFSEDEVKKLLKNNDLDLLVRAHQVVDNGFEFFADRSLVTVFSAPNYCGEHNNFGALLSCDELLTISFQVLRPRTRKNTATYYTGNRPATPPRNSKGLR